MLSEFNTYIWNSECRFFWNCNNQAQSFVIHITYSFCVLSLWFQMENFESLQKSFIKIVKIKFLLLEKPSQLTCQHYPTMTVSLLPDWHYTQNRNIQLCLLISNGVSKQHNKCLSNDQIWCLVTELLNCVKLKGLWIKLIILRQICTLSRENLNLIWHCKF